MPDDRHVRDEYYPSLRVRLIWVGIAVIAILVIAAILN
jgi:hypothetical protein